MRSVLQCITLCIVAGGFTTNLQSDSLYTVTCRKFDKKIYSQKRSLFRLTSTNTTFSLIETGYQKIIKTEVTDNNRSITVQCGLRKTGNGDGRTDTARYLEDTQFLQINDLALQKTVRALSREKDPVTAVQQFVKNHITYNTAGIAIVDAPFILKNRIGDCTEYSVLTIALLRALKIPSRAVVGIILSRQFNGEHDVFVYHMWAEAFVDGRWILVDSTRPGNIRHNRYIAFTTHSLQTMAPLTYLKAISSIRNMQIEYVQ